MNRKLVNYLLIIVAVFLISGCGKKVDNEEVISISGCNSYGDTGCSQSFKNLDFGDSSIFLRYEFVKGYFEEDALRIYIDDFLTREYNFATEITLEHLGVIDDVILIVLSYEGYEGDTNYSLEAFDENGITALEYSGMIEDMWIYDISSKNDKIIIDASKAPSDQGLSICIEDFYQKSSYAMDSVVVKKFEIKYDGNQVFSEALVVDSETMDEYRNRNCN